MEEKLKGTQEHTLQAAEAFIKLFGYLDIEEFKSSYAGHYYSWNDFVEDWLVSVNANPNFSEEDFKQSSFALNCDYAEQDGFLFLRH